MIREKPELILHIGTLKTGSTSLQSAFDNNTELLCSEGIYYPPSQYAFWGRVLYSSINKELQSGLWAEDERKIKNLKNSTDDLVRRVICQFNKSNCIKILISNESFSLIPDIYRFANMNANRLAESSQRNDVFEKFNSFVDLYNDMLIRIKQLFDDFSIKIVCYVRRQDFFIESHYNQLNKRIGHMNGAYSVLKECRNYQEFIKSTNDYPFIDFTGPEYFNDISIYDFKNTCYYECLSRWAEVFGKENIIVKPFEKAQFNKGLIKDFFIDVLKINENKLKELKEMHINEKISRDLVEYLTKYEAAGNYYDNDDLYDITRKLNNKHMYQHYFTIQERAQLMNYHKEGNEKIAREFLGRLDGILFYEAMEIEEEIYPGLSDDTKEFLDEEFDRIKKRNKRTMYKSICYFKSKFARQKGYVQKTFYYKGVNLKNNSIIVQLYALVLTGVLAVKYIVQKVAAEGR